MTQSYFKHIVLVLCLVLTIYLKPFELIGQTNYVVNGGFENRISCPTNYGDVDLAVGWSEPKPSIIPPLDSDPLKGTNVLFRSEFFHKCYKNPLNGNAYPIGFPANVWDQAKFPRTGNGSAGILAYEKIFLPQYSHDNISSILQGTLLPLTANHKYHFEMHLSMSNQLAEYISSNFGVLFSDTAISTNRSLTPLWGVTPSIIDTNHILETGSSWYKLKGDYVAKGTEKYLLIGCFKLDTIRRLLWDNSWSFISSEYFIDDVSLIDCTNATRENILGNDTVLCDTMSFNLDARISDGTAVYSWSTGAGNVDHITVTTPGEYKVQISINGCPPFRDSIIIDRRSKPVFDLGKDTILCLIKGISLKPTPYHADSDYRYRWNTGDTTYMIGSDTAGTYSLSINDHGCTNSDTIHIYRYPLKEFNLGPDTSLCSSDSITLDATTLGSQGYHWSTGDTTSAIKVIRSGLYWGEAYNGLCHFRDSFLIDIRPYPLIELGPPLQLACSNSPLKLDAGNAGATYLWNNGDTSRIQVVTKAGLYHVRVNLNGCIKDTETLVSIAPAPSIELGPDTTLCEDQNIILNATTTGATYRWQDFSTQPTYTVNKAGKYKVEVTLNKCVSTDSITVNVDSKPPLNLGPDHASCFDTEELLDASAAMADKYQWNDNSTTPTINAKQADTYWVIVTKGTCTATDSITLTQAPKALPELGTDSILCAGSTKTLTPGTFTTYQWNTGSTAPTININTPGLYKVQVQNTAGCVGTDSITLIQIPLPNAYLGKDTGICEPDLLLHPQQGYPSYIWNDGSGTSTYHVTGYGTFSVTIKDQYGCSNTGQITISNDCPTTLFVPNAFTPNGDNNNDEFKPIGSNVKEISWSVYDRWGQLLFTTNNMNKGWDGSSSGQLQPSDVYVYIVKYVDLKNREKVMKGNVTLLR